MTTNQRPLAGEFHPYFSAYIDLVPDGDIGETLERQLNEADLQFAAFTERQALYRYAPGKWSVQEVLGHMADTERIMSYRLLRIARGDATPLPGFDENAYVQGASFDARSLGSVRAEFEAVRRATLQLVRGLPDEAWTRQGTANGFNVTARAIAYIIAGHELHHRRVIERKYAGAR